MRPFRFLAVLSCIAAGVVVGALNPQPVSLDLGFAVLHGTLGVALLVALLAGALVGGLALSASVLLPLRRELERERARNRDPASAPRAEEGGAR